MNRDAYDKFIEQDNALHDLVIEYTNCWYKLNCDQVGTRAWDRPLFCNAHVEIGWFYNDGDKSDDWLEIPIDILLDRSKWENHIKEERRKKLEAEEKERLARKIKENESEIAAARQMLESFGYKVEKTDA
jgi:hypothetical protein